MPTTNINLNLSYVESVTGTAVDNTDPQNPVIDIPSNGITGVAPVGNLLRVLTVDGGGNVVTVEASHIYESSTSCQMYIDSPSAYYEVGVLDTITGDVAGFQAQPIFSRMYQQGAIFELVGEEAFLKTTSVPFGGAGIIGVDAAGKLFTTTSGGGTTTNPLTIGTGLSGTSFNGSAAVTIEIDSTVATLSGAQALTNKTGLISQWTNDSGYLTSVTNISGNAATATALQTARAINGVSFDGTAAITVTADANTLTGTTLHSTVVSSSLTSVGALSSGSLAAGFTAVAATVGGTGQSTVTTGDLLYGSASNTWSKLASGATAGMYLRNGGASTAPVWSTLILPNSATANGIVYATSTNTYGESSNFTFDGTTLKNGNASSLSTATPTTIDMGGTFADTIVSSKAKWKLYNDGTAINTYGIGISSGQLNFFKFTGGSYNWYFSNVEKMKLSETALTIADAISIAVGTSTGTKIGTATSQKLSLWNKTPIAQPTTAITGATLTGGGGTTITATDTFGGYTLQQIAAALINTGILA